MAGLKMSKHESMIEQAGRIVEINATTKEYRDEWGNLFDSVLHLGEDSADLLYWKLTKDDLDRGDYKLLVAMIDSCYPFDYYNL